MICPIQLASRLSGLSAHVIRMWERRYGALSPTRTGTNRRMYCEEAIKRLKLLRTLTEGGHRIGQLAKLETGALEELVRKMSNEAVEPPSSQAQPQVQAQEAGQYVERALEASKHYDSDGVRRILLQARMQLGQRGMLHKVICPLIMKIGESWQQGNLRPSHEHIATAVIRELLLSPVPGSQTALHAPELVVATPAGELHELGALIVAASARDLGWHVTYLGPNLPVEEISACALARHATAVALSVVYPEGCPVIESKLRRMCELLPPGIALIVGGRAASGYQARLPDLPVHWAGSLHGLDDALLKIRK